MLNTDGRVACSTIANIFLMKDGKLITPARDQAILTGVMRQALIAAAQHIWASTPRSAPSSPPNCSKRRCRVPHQQPALHPARSSRSTSSRCASADLSPLDRCPVRSRTAAMRPRPTVDLSARRTKPRLRPEGPRHEILCRYRRSEGNPRTGRTGPARWRHHQPQRSSPSRAASSRK